MRKRVVKRYHSSNISRYRFADNPMERAFANAWVEANNNGSSAIVPALLDTQGRGGSRYDTTAREERVAAEVIQWLGSPVGSPFLMEVLQRPAFKEFRAALHPNAQRIRRARTQLEKFRAPPSGGSTRAP